MPQNLFNKSHFLILLLLTLTTASYEQHKSRHHHKHHRHKHQILANIDSNELNEIREAFDDYRKSVQYRDRISEEAVNINSLNEEEETVPAQSYLQNAMQRHKRVHTTTRMTSTSTTTTPKSVDNYDEEYEDDDNDTNRRANDDARVQIQRRQQVTEVLNPGETLTDFKNANLGTREGVERSFQQHLQTQRLNNPQDLFREYSLNFFRTKIDGLCRWPNKKAIEMPFHASKNYSPRKYIIHQCSDEASCCGSTEKTCVAKRSENVTLWFQVQYVNQSFSYESLRVLNHTECQCIYKFQHRPHHTVASSHPTQRSHTVRCRCPLDFTVTTTRHGRSCECRCDNVECRMRYEGKEKFSISDRSCINGGTCTKPNCLAGAYDSSHGRCPPRNDRLKRHSTAQHHFIS